MYHACYVQITENGSGASVYQIVTRGWSRQAVPTGPNLAVRAARTAVSREV
jgi:hypothetical protein